MKKVLCYIMLGFCLLAFTGCGETKRIDNVTYDTYGLFNKDDKRNPNVEYKIIVGNIVWSVLLCETIIAPIYFLGFSMYEPVCKKPDNAVKGQVTQ